MNGPEFDAVSLRVMFLCRLGILRDLTAEERLELQQLQAAEKAEPQPQEVRQ